MHILMENVTLFRDILLEEKHKGDSTINDSVAEALARDLAVLFARSLDFKRVIVEGDSSLITKKVQSFSLDKSVSFAQMANVKRRIFDFDNITFHHVGRYEPAYVLVKLGRLFPLPKIWIGEAPDLIEEVIQRDRWWIESPD
ncbi:hypothetical protein V6N13_007631 [Hibiscus sabdariffa]|uniref:RNase H type-1 domain-containing protein n=1 Tax=Hibiscus sabdariffa TaxID=183260 RepID=A0ABR2EPX0_9ROSI